MDVKGKLEKLAGDVWVPNNTPNIAKNLLKNINKKIYSQSQIELIQSIVSQYTGRV